MNNGEQYQHQWPSLGKELFAQERALADPLLSSQQFQVEQQKLRESTLAQLYQQEGQYSRATRYLAFLLVRLRRGGEIVGNPSHGGKNGARQELPYTGLEGYYAGSERTAGRPGLTLDDILQEEALLGRDLLKAAKKHAAEQDCWADFVHLQHTLDGREQDRASIRTIQTLWATLIGQLRGRVYHNPEFELTLAERIEQAEQMLGKFSTRAEEKGVYQALQAETLHLKAQYQALSEQEETAELMERRRREYIRNERLAAFRRFREETYQILEASGQGRYDIGIQDRSWDKATIIETIMLPYLPAREMYPSVQVHWEPEELDGYLFLARLGEIGADPLSRSELVSR